MVNKSDVLIGILICVCGGIFIVAALIGGSLHASDSRSMTDYLESQGFRVRSKPFSTDAWFYQKEGLYLEDFIYEANKHNIDTIFADYEDQDDKRWVTFWFFSENTKFALIDTLPPKEELKV